MCNQPCSGWCGSCIGRRGRCECGHTPDLSGCYAHCFRIAGYFCATFNPDNLDDPKELDGTDVAVVKGEIGVAENGAIWIPQTVKYKAIYFISEKLVILLDRNKIVDTMYDAYRELDGQEYRFGTVHLRSIKDC